MWCVCVRAEMECVLHAYLQCVSVCLYICVSVPIYVCMYVCMYWMCFVNSQDCISSLCCDTNCAVTMLECTVLELMLHFLLMVACVSLYSTNKILISLYVFTVKS